MTNKIFTISIILLGMTLFSCNNKNIETKNDEILKEEQKAATQNDFVSVYEYLEKDTLSNMYNYKIDQFFENGNPALVYYYDKSDPDNPKYQKIFYQSGKLYIEGALKNGKRSGKWYAWYENGLLCSSGSYINGIDDGLKEVYYEDGTMRYYLNYVNGKLEGDAKYYNEKGELALELTYRNNEIISQKNHNKGLINK